MCRCTRTRPDDRGYRMAQRFHVTNEAADRNIDLKQPSDILAARHAGKVFAANEAVICRHRRSKRIGLMLETSNKDVHEKLPVLRSPTIERLPVIVFRQERTRPPDEENPVSENCWRFAFRRYAI